MNIYQPDANFDHVGGAGPWRGHRWGREQALTRKNRFKVRHLIVRPGCSITQQGHYHRAEHWIAVSGCGRITIGGAQQELRENQSVHIPACTAHALENHGRIDLHLIEVQTGGYLDDDDLMAVRDPS